MIAVKPHAFATVLSLCLVPVAHAEIKSVAAHVENVDYSNGRGHREVAHLDISGDVAGHRVVVELSHGRRDFGTERFEGNRASVNLYQKWSPLWSGRTHVAASSNDPVFANRDISQHVNFKAGDSVVLHLGGRYTEYYGDVNARIWTTGASYYRGQWISNYRYTRYHLSDREDGDSHLFSLRRKDRNGAGSTQLWLGRGSSAFAYETLPELEDSTSTSISLRRSQPLTENIKLDALIGRTLHDSPHARYHGVSSRIGVGYHW